MTTRANRWIAPCVLALAAVITHAHADGGGKDRAARRKPTPSTPAAGNAQPVQQRRAPRAPAAAPAAVASPAAVRAARPTDVEFGAPIHYQNISVIPVLTKRKGPFERYTLLEQGVKAKTFEVREMAGNAGEATVSQVEVRNTGKDAVYLLGGEMILGGKQDRIIAQDTVVPKGGEWTTVGVFCVEQGRWNGQSMEFSAGSAMADVAIQRAAMKGSQSEVWQEVSKKNVFHNTQSSTQTYRRTIQNADVRKKVSPYVAELKSQLPEGVQVAGMVFGVNGRIHVADLFGNPVLFGDLSDKLLSAYVLEALSHQVDNDAAPVSAADAAEFYDKGRKAKPVGVKKSGRAKQFNVETDEVIGAETVDEGTGKTVRETYIGK